MALLWVKMHIGLLDNDAFRQRLTPDARLTFLIAIMLAGKQNQGGRLEIRDVGPMTEAEIALYTGLPIKRQEDALRQLVTTGAFLSRDTTGAYVVERFDEKAGKTSEDASNSERQRRYREKIRNASNGVSNGGVTVVTNEKIVTDIDKEEDKDKECNGVTPFPNSLEADVEIYVANAAAENKTGKISDGRAQGLRRELLALLDEIGEPAFASGLREANAKGVANKNYVKKCAASLSKRDTKVIPAKKSRVIPDSELV